MKLPRMLLRTPSSNHVRSIWIWLMHNKHVVSLIVWWDILFHQSCGRKLRRACQLDVCNPLHWGWLLRVRTKFKPSNQMNTGRWIQNSRRTRRSLRLSFTVSMARRLNCQTMMLSKMSWSALIKRVTLISRRLRQRNASVTHNRPLQHQQCNKRRTHN